MTAHYSKATIAGHPIHPMLVGFPIAFYTAGLVSLIVYATIGSKVWYEAAMGLWFAGAGFAALAAVFGTIDLLAGIPRGSEARKTGVKHFALNVITLLLFTGAALGLYQEWRFPSGTGGLSVALPLEMGIAGFALTIGAGALGWKLVQTHHVGIDERP